LWLHGVLCLAVALLYHDNTPALIGFLLIYMIFYRVSYRDAERRSGERTIARRAIPFAGD
jgi:hypothetical protein